MHGVGQSAKRNSPLARVLIGLAVLALLVITGRGRISRNTRGAVGSHGYGAVAVGFVMVLVGFVVILYAVWTSGTIPINNITLSGVVVAGVGVAVGAIGLDRGVSVKG